MLTIVADIRAKAEHVEEVKAALDALVAPTRLEQGCIQYDLHQDDQDPAHFLFYETWSSREMWQDHVKSDHIAAYREACRDKLASSTVYELTRLTR